MTLASERDEIDSTMGFDGSSASTAADGRRWTPVLATLIAVVGFAVLIVFLALVVAPSAGAAGGCGGG